jgi:hypothetical protein
VGTQTEAEAAAERTKLNESLPSLHNDSALAHLKSLLSHTEAQLADVLEEHAREHAVLADQAARHEAQLQRVQGEKQNLMADKARLLDELDRMAEALEQALSGASADTEAAQSQRRSQAQAYAAVRRKQDTVAHALTAQLQALRVNAADLRSFVLSQVWTSGQFRVGLLIYMVSLWLQGMLLRQTREAMGQTLRGFANAAQQREYRAMQTAEAQFSQRLARVQAETTAAKTLSVQLQERLNLAVAQRDVSLTEARQLQVLQRHAVAARTF